MAAMSTLTIKLPPELARELERASQRAHLTKSELTRRALQSYIAQQQRDPTAVSALDLAGDLVGCFEGGPADLSSNPEYMKDFGRV